MLARGEKVSTDGYSDGWCTSEAGVVLEWAEVGGQWGPGKEGERTVGVSTTSGERKIIAEKLHVVMSDVRVNVG